MKISVYKIIIIAIFATTLFISCSNNDDDLNEFTYTFDTTNMTLSEGSPCTLDQIAKEYQSNIQTSCDKKYYYNVRLENCIITTFDNQRIKGWTKYYHGYALIICHYHIRPEQITPVFKFDFDANKLIEFPSTNK